MNLRAIGIVVLLLTAIVGSASARTAERFVAADGFSAPQRIVRMPAATQAALALDQGTPVAYWYDPTGIHRIDLVHGEQRVVFEGRGVRGIGAVSAGGDPAVLRIVRDFRTGRSEHVVRWRGEERTAASALQVLPIALAADRGQPVWLTHAREGGLASLTLAGWDREPVLVRVTEKSVGGYDVAFDADGSGWVTWLEGTTERSALGVVASWTAHLAHVTAQGSVGEMVTLGSAQRRSEVDRTRLGRWSGGSPAALWPREDGALVTTTFPSSDGIDASFEAGRTDTVLGPGVAIGIFADAAYWAAGDRIFRRAVEPGAAAVPVLWSPNAIEAGHGVIAPDGDLFLVWHGGSLSSTFSAYVAGTADPFEPNWTDHVAAAMQWNPWNVWAEAFGQFLASILAGILVTMALSPVLWGASALVVRYGKIHDGTWIGIGIGAATVLTAVGLLRMRVTLPGDAVDALFGTWWHMAVALALAVALTWFGRRGRDSEPLLGTLVSAASCAGAATAVLAFLTYSAWAGSWLDIL